MGGPPSAGPSRVWRRVPNAEGGLVRTTLCVPLSGDSANFFVGLAQPVVDLGIGEGFAAWVDADTGTVRANRKAGSVVAGVGFSPVGANGISGPIMADVHFSAVG